MRRTLPRLVVNKALDDRELTASVLVASFKTLLPTEPLRELYVSISDDLFSIAAASEEGRLGALKVMHHPVHWLRSDTPELRLWGSHTISAVRQADAAGQEAAMAWARRWRLATPAVVRWAVQQRRYWALFGRSAYFSEAVRQSHPARSKPSSSDLGERKSAEGATPQAKNRSKFFQNAMPPWSQLPFFFDGHRGNLSPRATKILRTLDTYPQNGRWAEGRPWPRSRAEVNDDHNVLRRVVDDSGGFVEHPAQHDTWLDGGLTENDEAAAPIAWEFWRESEEETIARARRHCAARRALLSQHYPIPLHGVGERREIQRHCEWLLRARVLMESPRKIAQTSSPTSTPNTVSAAVTRLERVLELEPMMGSGRPRKKL